MPDWTPDELKNWRKRVDFTQAQAAERLGISLRAYSDRENGNTAITAECVLACMMTENLQTGRLIGNAAAAKDVAIAGTMQKLEGELRAQRIMLEALVVAMVRAQHNTKVANWIPEIAMDTLNRTISNDDPYMRGHVYEAVTQSLNSLRAALGN